MELKLSARKIKDLLGTMRVLMVGWGMGKAIKSPAGWQRSGGVRLGCCGNNGIEYSMKIDFIKQATFYG